jgi:hypothetical protein
MTDKHSVCGHVDLREMVPWHLNGTLNDADRKRVAAHLEDCAACRSDSADFDAMRAAVRSGDIAPLIPATRATDILAMDRPVQERTKSDRSRTWFAVAAAATLVAVAVSYNTDQERESSANIFQTATTDSTTMGVNYVLQMQFVVDTSVAERRLVVEGLGEVGKWTVDQNGVYEIHMRLDDQSLAGLEAFETRLRGLAVVKSAEFIAMQLPVR